MAKTLPQRVSETEDDGDDQAVPNRAGRRARIKARLEEIRQDITETSAGAVRLGLGYTVPALLVVGQCRLAYPWGSLPFPSHQTIAERIGRHPETVGRQLRALEKAGLISVFRTCARPGPDGQLTRRTNRYQFRSKAAMAIKACPLPRRRRSHLDNTSVARPPNRGAVPAPPPSRPVAEAPQMVDPPPKTTSEEVVDGRQALAGVRAVLAQARRTT